MLQRLSPQVGLLAALLPLGLACSGGTAGPQTGIDPGVVPTSRADAVRFLNRATFGATPDDTAFIALQGYTPWLNDQFAQPPSLMLPELLAIGCAPDQPGYTFFNCQGYESDEHNEARVNLWWEHAVSSPDQLRQRVAFALSQIFVVSDRDALLGEFPSTMADYYDTLARGAFGNYRDLLEEITLHPAMGAYLSMAKNRVEDPVLGTRPDENFAREVMQLFSIGLSELDASGELVLDPFGQPIPTYDQTTIKEMARALTGWTYKHVFPPSNDLAQFLGTYPRIGRMEPWPAFHDNGAKMLVGGASVPPFLSPEEDLAAVLDALATHPNVGPFMGKQLIQRLVTSNPSPEYIARVSAVWDDDGNGVRGNLEAVVRAILMDREALDGHEDAPQTFGKLKEPILRVTGLWRAFEAEGTTTIFPYLADEYLGQRAQGAPSVFNFYSPTYTTGDLASQGLVAPEMQITTHSRITRTGNALTYVIVAGNDVVPDPNFQEPILQLDGIRQTSANVPEFVDLLDERLCGGLLSDASRTALENHLVQVPYVVPGFANGYFRTVEGLALVTVSTDFAIQQ